MSVVTSDALIPVELTNIHSVSWILSKAQRFRFMVFLPFNAHFKYLHGHYMPTLLARSQRNDHCLETCCLGTIWSGMLEEALGDISPTSCSKHGHPGQTTQFGLENVWRMKSFYSWNHCCSRLQIPALGLSSWDMKCSISMPSWSPTTKFTPIHWLVVYSGVSDFTVFLSC